VEVFLVHTLEVNGLQCCLVPNVLQNIFFNVPLKKITNTGLERIENETLKGFVHSKMTMIP